MIGDKQKSIFAWNKAININLTEGLSMNYSVLLLQTARVMFQAVMGDINIKLKKFCIRSKLEKNLTTDMLMEQRRNTMA